MVVNLFLAALILVMIVREMAMWARYRHPFRLGLLTFWALLGVAHFTGRREIYPALVVIWLVAMGLRRRDGLEGRGMFDRGAASKAKPAPTPSDSGVWDRDLDRNP